MRKRLRYLTLSLPQSLVDRPVIPWGSQPPVVEDTEGEHNKPCIIQEEDVNDMLLLLDTHKSMGLDETHPRLLRELVEELAKSLSIL